MNQNQPLWKRDPRIPHVRGRRRGPAAPTPGFGITVHDDLPLPPGGSGIPGGAAREGRFDVAAGPPLRRRRQAFKPLTASPGQMRPSSLAG